MKLWNLHNSESNIFFSSNLNISIFSVGGTIYRSLANFKDAFPSKELNSQQGNPNFVSDSDFHLTSESRLCIDKGASLIGLVNNDFDNSSRPIDGDGSKLAQWDIGPYEYSSPSSILDVDDKTIHVYPTYVNDFLNIDSHEDKFLQFEIQNANGELVLESKFNNKVNISILIPGIYFLNLYNDNQVPRSIKFIKI